MTEQEFYEILKRYLDGEATSIEEKWIEDFYKNNQEKKLFKDYTQEEEAKIRRLLKKRIFAKIDALDKSKTSFNWFKVAASVVVVVGLSVMLYFLQFDAEINYLTAYTGKGEKITITLDDGSVIKLNTESSVQYPEKFTEDVRAVKLTGEAFFEVKTNKQKPFIVHTKALKTQVLGTSFNINAYDSLKTSVALVSGQVQVENFKQHNDNQTTKKILKPGQMAVLGVDEQLQIQNFDLKMLTAWKDNVIYFSEANHQQVFQQLSKWYGVDFKFKNQPKEVWAVNGEFKDMRLEQVLQTISYTKDFDYKISDKTISITFKN